MFSSSVRFWAHFPFRLERCLRKQSFINLALYTLLYTDPFIIESSIWVGFANVVVLTLIRPNKIINIRQQWPLILYEVKAKWCSGHSVQHCGSYCLVADASHSHTHTHAPFSC